MHILVTGATGLVGKKLCHQLLKEGHQLSIVSRSPGPHSDTRIKVLCADLNKNLLPVDSIVDVEAVIHLAGESIQGFWSKEKKARILNSRVVSTENLIKSFQEQKKLKVWIGVSAIGFYGDRGDEILSEDSQKGEGFLSEVTQAWEDVSHRDLDRTDREIRRAIFRVGIVLAKEGGALQAIQQPVKLGVGASLGTGKQWMSWIHLDDLVLMLCEALIDSEIKGVINAVAPTPVRHSEMMSMLAQKLHRWLLPNIPGVFLKMTLGEMSQLVLSSQRVVSKTSHKFRFADLNSALDDLLSKKNQ